VRLWERSDGQRAGGRSPSRPQAGVRRQGAAQRYSAERAALDEHWRAQVGKVRGRSGTDRLLAVFPGAPIVAVESASAVKTRQMHSRHLRLCLRALCGSAFRRGHQRVGGGA